MKYQSENRFFRLYQFADQLAAVVIYLRYIRNKLVIRTLAYVSVSFIRTQLFHTLLYQHLRPGRITGQETGVRLVGIRLHRTREVDRILQTEDAERAEDDGRI